MSNRLKCISSKEVLAVPMTYGEYYIYRGYSLLEGEHAEQKGYLMIHDRETKDHREYWKTESQFKDEYTVIGE